MFPLQWFWQSPWKDLPQMRRKWGVFAHDLASQKRRSVSGVISSENICGEIKRSERDSPLVQRRIAVQWDTNVRKTETMRTRELVCSK